MIVVENLGLDDEGGGGRWRMTNPEKSENHQVRPSNQFPTFSTSSILDSRKPEECDSVTIAVPFNVERVSDEPEYRAQIRENGRYRPLPLDLGKTFLDSPISTEPEPRVLGVF